MGLYGASTNCWDMSTAAHHTFDGFWETLAFVVNALVFMWSGAHVVNFFIRCEKGTSPLPSKQVAAAAGVKTRRRSSAVHAQGVPCVTARHAPP
jgi:hypothetical protein